VISQTCRQLWRTPTPPESEGQAISISHPKVAVIGASADRSKYGNKAVRAFRDEGWEVYPINPRLTEVEGITAYPSLDAVPVSYLDRVIFYVHPEVGLRLIEDLVLKDVREVWFNPGSESPELVARAEALELKVIQACSILAIGRLPSRY
jgi:predicted CoA-binding protein